jgi:hypothetical protein
LLDRVRVMAAGGGPAAILPFKHPPAPVRARGERRHAVSAALVAELRRELRRADLERYARQGAPVFPDLRRALKRQKRPIGAVMAGLGAGIVLIASGEVMSLAPPPESIPAVRSPEPLLAAPAAPPDSIPAVRSPQPRLAVPAAAYALPPPAGWSLSPPAPSRSTIDDTRQPDDEARAGTVPVLRRTSSSQAMQPATRVRNERAAEGQKPRGIPTARGERRERSGGVLARLRLQWIRNIFTYRKDL